MNTDINFTMRTKNNYVSPPIVEALCEFRFEGSMDWDWTIPGLIYNQIKDSFPIKQQANTLEVNLNLEAKTPSTKTAVALNSMRFLREDKTAMVQVGADMLAVNMFPPYPGWESFLTVILENLDIYRQEVEPKGIMRIGVRYINRFKFPPHEFKLADYFNIYPHLPSTIPQKHGPFNMVLASAYKDERDRLNVRVGNPTPDTTTAIEIDIDLDYFLLNANAVTLDNATEWIINAHDTVENIFEAAITDKCRGLMNKQAEE